MKRSVLFVIFLTAIMLSSCTRVREESRVPDYTLYGESDSVYAGSLQETPQESTAPVVLSVPTEEKDAAEKLLESMSLEEKIGQVILARYPETAEEAAEQMSAYRFGGFTLYSEDFENETPESLSEKLSRIREASAVPPFIAADEEGGKIVRISKNPAFADKPLPSLASTAAEGRIPEFAEELSAVLNRAGVNLNLAPVADVAESRSDYIYSRTCGLDYEGTAEVIAELVKNLNERGVMCCLKHFPGYGSNVDTHTGIAVDRRSADDFESKDFLPFRAGIDAGAPMVMVNHNIVGVYNAEMPASLSPEVHEALRGLGFEGIIITDDLGMDAIADYTDSPYAAAFLAGNDMLCATDGAKCFDDLLEAVKSGDISEERLDESVLRILRAKLEYGIL
ncbi:MAG: beta-hexosaminidase [Oscillospiraceae bacterium]|nr:beta-hexosaminidase [Oscillospiraceae bacterium]